MNDSNSSTDVELKRRRYFDQLYTWLDSQNRLIRGTPLSGTNYFAFGQQIGASASAAALADAHLQSQLRLIKATASPTNQGAAQQNGGAVNSAAGSEQPNLQQQQAPQPQPRRANPRQVYGGRLGIEGYRFRVAPIWKRVCAELIDGLLLLALKLILMVLLEQRIDFVVDSLLPVDNRLWKAESSLNQQHQQQRQRMAEFSRRFGTGGANFHQHQQQHLELDIAGLRFSMADLLSPRLILMDLMVRLMVLLLETLALSGCFGLFRTGQTPGKWLFNLQVVQANDVIDLPDQIIEVLPANPLSFQRALARSAIKNLAMMFFFPVWATAFVFSNHRTSYDIITSTIVVENLPPED